MNIFSITCTRDLKLNSVTQGLVDTLSSFGVHSKLLFNQTSIFEAYKKGIIACDADDTDIIILCHDDIQLPGKKEDFIAALSLCVHKETGIIGPAGTTLLGADAVWWNQERWQSGYHRGMVRHKEHFKPPPVAYQLEKNTQGCSRIYETNYGPPGEVVALDGLFLAARKEVWDAVGVSKPEYFEGNWDFYDIHYTTKAHTLGYKNHAVFLDIIHQSAGTLTGRDSWHKNRESFIANTELPLSC